MSKNRPIMCRDDIDGAGTTYWIRDGEAQSLAFAKYEFRLRKDVGNVCPTLSGKCVAGLRRLVEIRTAPQQVYRTVDE